MGGEGGEGEAQGGPPQRLSPPLHGRSSTYARSAYATSTYAPFTYPVRLTTPAAQPSVGRTDTRTSSAPGFSSSRSVRASGPEVTRAPSARTRYPSG